MNQTAFRFVMFSLLAAFSISHSVAEEWSQFRGPDGQAISRSKVPNTWTGDKNIACHVYWVHETNGTVSCVNADKGEVVYEESRINWQTEVTSTPAPPWMATGC